MRARQVVVPGTVCAGVVALDEPLSFWGGFDSATGNVIDEHHPQVGTNLTAKVVAMSRGRGSSSATSVLTEAVRRHTEPAALVMLESDEILSTGAIVAEELYGRTVPILLVDQETFAAVAAASEVTIKPDGTIQVA